MKFNLKNKKINKIRLLTEAIDRIDAVIGALGSLFGAAVGSAIYNSEIINAVTKGVDPEWFCQLAPILQTVAWVGAGVVSFFTTVKLCLEIYGIRKGKKIKRKNENESR